MTDIDNELADAYKQCAERNVLAALNPKVFFGYFSVCADGKGHGGDSTFPGLDWGQSAEALMWLGRTPEALASWEYVKTFIREDGLLPLAIFPSQAGKTSMVHGKHPFAVAPNGGLYRHWFPSNPLLVLANATFLIMGDAMHRFLQDRAWLDAQTPALRRVADWLAAQVEPEGLVPGGAYYLERPTRLQYDGIGQCYAAHALRLASQLTGDRRYEAVADRIRDCFRRRFWADGHCVEYINPEHGPISSHGLTDVDWAAIATGMASEEQCAVLWPQLRDNADFLYDGIPTGIATRPETYEDWEMMHMGRHDLAAMGRVWFLESWARWRMGDRDGLIESLRRVARKGRERNWSWWERYYSERTGDVADYHFDRYCEYPACFIRIVHRFVLGAESSASWRGAPRLLARAKEMNS